MTFGGRAGTLKKKKQTKTTDQCRYYKSVIKFLIKLFLDTMYKHFPDNQVLTPNQSGF